MSPEKRTGEDILLRIINDAKARTVDKGECPDHLQRNQIRDLMMEAGRGNRAFASWDKAVAETKTQKTAEDDLAAEEEKQQSNKTSSVEDADMERAETHGAENCQSRKPAKATSPPAQP